jgi:polar amino acid transport system substrate-binding protein
MNDLRRVFLVPILALMAGCVTADRAGSEHRALLAPTGKLRVGVNVGSPTSLVRANPQAEPRGVTYELGKELARRLGVPMELVEFRNVNDVLAAMKDGKVDFSGSNATAVRAAIVDFTATVIEIEVGYLVPEGSALQTVEDMKRPGLRIAVTQGATSQTTLPRLLPQAVIVPAANIGVGAQMLKDRSIDAYSTNKAILFEVSDGVPGSRVLAGSIGGEQWALAIPKGRQAALPFLNAFLKEARQSGELAKIVERSGLRGSRLP